MNSLKEYPRCIECNELLKLNKKNNVDKKLVIKEDKKKYRHIKCREIKEEMFLVSFD
jgi:hypothetical protein